MFSFFKPPKSSYSNEFEISKYSVTWSIFIFLLFVFLALGCYHAYIEDPNVKTTFAGFSMTLVSLIILWKTKKYYISAVLIAVLGTLISQYSLFVIDDSDRFIDLMWIMLIAFYSFYTLGSFWGAITLSANLTGLLIKVTLFTESTQKTGTVNHINTIINVFIATVVVIFIIHKLISSSELLNKELKKLNDKLAVQNDEKTVLLKEIHHRVKNNLQVVSSLLRLQASELTDENTKAQFSEAVSRIGSMALIHEKMYQKEDLANLDLKIYLDSLIEELMYSYSTIENVNVNIDSNLEHMEIKNLVPIALIFNELITNSLKHAFKNGKDGEIHITIQTKGKDVNIIYKDNGTWVKSDNEHSFGMTLIDTFTEQLDGKYTLNLENGTEYHFCFSTPRK